MACTVHCFVLEVLFWIYYLNNLLPKLEQKRTFSTVIEQTISTINRSSLAIKYFISAGRSLNSFLFLLPNAFFESLVLKGNVNNGLLHISHFTIL